MKIINVILIIFLFASSSLAIAGTTVTKASGGGMKTNLGYGIALNKDSTVQREWITIHDDSLPVNLIGTVGINVIFDDRKFQYSARYSIETKEAISAIEVRFLTFDIWGDHVKNLSSTKITDIDKGGTKKFDAKWNEYSENRASEYYASIAYIAQVRTKDGHVLKANPNIVLNEARKFSKKFSKRDLEPTPEKK